MKLDKSVGGRSPGKCVGRSEQHRQSQYTPTWLNINVGTLSEVMEYDENSDDSEAIAISSFNQFCWQGPGGTKVVMLYRVLCYLQTSQRSEATQATRFSLLIS